MMFAIMPVSHTHRISWRSWKPFLALSLLVMIGLATLAPIATPYAHAQPVEPPAAGTEPETPAIDPATAPEPPAISAADQTLCSPDFSTSVLGAARCVFFNVIAEILLLIASLLGRILVFMVDILIAFASYNDFGGTMVVQRGWVIVRDICNMFFIVVLLVSAFATIIGYDEGNFHYKRVLPKLLLMAVLINFSRTLILLLIDFSQVIMLTFVNAFAQAGPGNLVAALKMEQVLKLAPTSAGAGTDAVGTAIANSGIAAGSVDPMNLILAIMLAIFMLSISLGVVVIMVAYLIFRIVGLWLALILSPIALFATALPGRLQKGLDSFTGKYWSRLTAMITGGPVMAFFLWLTFAITQNSVGEGGLAPALKFNVTNPTVTFLTTIGNSQDIASFIIGITLMLMGLDAAVTVSGQVSETLGGFAKKTASASRALGNLAATAPFLGAYYGGRGAARYIDRRADISGRAATGVAATVGQIPILRSFIRKPLTDVMTRNKRLDQQETKDYQAGLENMTPQQRAIMAAATPKSRIATKGQRAAYAQQQMERAAPKNSQAMKDEIMPGKIAELTGKSNMAAIQNELKAAEKERADAVTMKDDVGIKEADDKIKGARSKMVDEERKIKTAASRDAESEVTKRQAELLGQAMTSAKAMGDDDMVRSIEEQYKKNPQLNVDRMGMAKTLLADKKALNGMSDQAKGSGEVITALIDESKGFKTDAKGDITGFDRAKMDSLKESKVTDKGFLSNIEMMEKYVNGQNAAGKPVNRKQLESMLIANNEKGKPRMYQRGSMAPVMNESAKQAQAAFKADPKNLANMDKMIEQVDASDVFQHPDASVWTTYRDAAKSDLSGLAGFEVVETEANGKTTLTPSMTRSQVDARLERFERGIKKIDDMAEGQQDEFLAIATEENIPEILVNVKRAGYADKGRDKVIDSYITKLLAMEKAGKESGQPNTQRDRATDALEQLRAAVEKKENKGFGSSWRQKLAPKETE